MTVERAARLFERRFGVAPAVVASAPGRVNLIGEHTDYNGGDVLPMALGLRTAVAVGRSSDTASHAVSEQEEQAGAFAAPAPRRVGAWWDYVAGACWAVEAVVGNLAPLRIAVSSDVPAGAGLSSSAALEVATAMAVASFAGHDLGTLQLARAAHRAETEFVGLPCGIMDQFASALGRAGHALWLACDTEVFRHVPFASSVLVFDTCTPRQLRASAYTTRRSECDAALRAVQRVDPAIRHLGRASEGVVLRADMPDVVRRRALHVVRETQRVAAFASRLSEHGAVGREAGAMLVASHQSLRSDYECSSPELDWFVDQAVAATGVTGARLTGAGWGGCAIAVGDEQGLRIFVDNVAPRFEATFGRSARWWMSQAGEGARVDRGRPG